LTFADTAKKVSDCDSGRSSMPTDDRDNFGAERLHPTVTNQRCRPTAEIREVKIDAAKPPLAASGRSRASSPAHQLHE
jgi:hypothetical protein